MMVFLSNKNSDYAVPRGACVRKIQIEINTFNPEETETREINISGILVKKAGDFPAFWHPHTSFIATMEELYHRVKTKNRDVF